MFRSINRSQAGMALPLIIAAVVVIAGIGGAGYYVWSKQSSKNSSTAATSTTATAAASSDAAKAAAAAFKCPYDDKDVCKFITNFRAYDKVGVTIESTDKDGAKYTSVSEIDGKNSHFKTTTGEGDWETIQIDTVTYTKASNGTWWKQAAKPAQDTAPDVSDTYKDDTKIFSDDTELSTTSFTKEGTEKCGDLTCYKYKSVDSKTPTDITYIWFDNKDFLLRKLQTTSPDSGTSTMTYSYKDIKVSTPSPVKELQANQYLVPGQDEPVTIPGA